MASENLAPGARLLRLVALAALLFLSGCVSFPAFVSPYKLTPKIDRINISRIISDDTSMAERLYQADTTRSQALSIRTLTRSECGKAIVPTRGFTALSKDGEPFTTNSMRASIRVALPGLADSSDAVIREVENAAIRTTLLTRMGVDASRCADVAPKDLTYRDFVKFTRFVTSNMLARSDAKAMLSERYSGAHPPLSAYLLVYLNNYNQGRFVDRFEDPLKKPDISTGVSNATISGFARVFLEAVFDASLAANGGGALYVDDPAKPKVFYPAASSRQPTAALRYPLDTTHPSITFVNLRKIAAPGEIGITPRESQTVEALANYSADRALVLSKAFLDELKSIDVGFALSGSFAIGDNETIKALATTVIETLARRTSETISYGVFSEIDGDRYPLVFLMGLLGEAPAGSS